MFHLDIKIVFYIFISNNICSDLKKKKRSSKLALGRTKFLCIKELKSKY